MHHVYAYVVYVDNRKNTALLIMIISRDNGEDDGR